MPGTPVLACTMMRVSLCNRSCMVVHFSVWPVAGPVSTCCILLNFVMYSQITIMHLSRNQHVNDTYDELNSWLTEVATHANVCRALGQLQEFLRTCRELAKRGKGGAIEMDAVLALETVHLECRSQSTAEPQWVDGQRGQLAPLMPEAEFHNLLQQTLEPLTRIVPKQASEAAAQGTSLLQCYKECKCAISEHTSNAHAQAHAHAHAHAHSHSHSQPAWK